MKLFVCGYDHRRGLVGLLGSLRRGLVELVVLTEADPSYHGARRPGFFVPQNRWLQRVLLHRCRCRGAATAAARVALTTTVTAGVRRLRVGRRLAQLEGPDTDLSRGWRRESHTMR